MTYQKLIQAITWNSINVFLYKCILLAHQILLFYFVPKELYGTAGTIFSSIYFLIGITNFGFEYTLFPFFAEYNTSKQSFRKIVQLYIIRLVTILVTTLGIWALLHYLTQNSNTISVLIFNIPKSLIGYLLIIFFTESCKKSLESLLQLVFYNKNIAIIQVAMIILYCSLVWSSYWIWNTITLHTIFIPMMIISIIESILFIGMLMHYYQTLSSQDQNSSVPSHALELPSSSKVFYQQLFLNYINQCTKSFFSPNFIMIFIALHLGMKQAGSIRFYTDTITLLYMLLNRAVGIPSGALFAHLKQKTAEHINKAFLKITNTYIQFLYFLGTFVGYTIAIKQLNQNLDLSVFPQVLFCVVLGFLEYFMLTYEKLYVVKQQALTLAIVNSISLITTFMYLYLYQVPQNQNILLLPFFIIRLISIISIGIITYKKWGLAPRLSIKYTTILCSMAAMGILHIIIIKIPFKILDFI